MQMRFLFFLLSMHHGSTYSRSLHRPKHRENPYVIISGQSKSYILDDGHLRYVPLKTFDKEYFDTHQLPSSISYRYNPTTTVKKEALDERINKLLDEIKKLNPSHPPQFSDFIILKRIDFNLVSKTGFIVLIFKDYPFVLKLFIENAYTISHPLSKGFQERGLFLMGGCLRHFSGFTRVKNAERTNEILKNSSWASRVTIPRKWFWVPHDPQWVNITLKNFDDGEEVISIPGIYAIVCDAINLAQTRPTNEECLSLSTALDYTIDPHVINFLHEAGTNKIAIIDTEHFPTLIGACEKIGKARNYIEWYYEMAKHYIQQNFFYTKEERIKRQKNKKTFYVI